MDFLAEGPMIWIKSVFVGLAAALVTVVAVVIATTAWSINIGEGGGGVGFVSVGVSELLFLPAVLAFALGFRWMLRRHGRLQRQ